MKAFAYAPVGACLAVLVIAVTVAPADARHAKRHHRHTAMRAPLPGDTVREPDPYGVYFGGYKVSRDPDPNVRQELLRDHRGDLSLVTGRWFLASVARWPRFHRPDAAIKRPTF